MGKKHRSADSKQGVIASVSYERDNLLARGLGLDHLKELVTRGLARPLLRNNMSLSYSGHWKDEEDNFTLHLLRLIAAEQEDSSLGGPDTRTTPSAGSTITAPGPTISALRPRSRRNGSTAAVSCG